MLLRYWVCPAVIYLHLLLSVYGSASNGPAWDEVGHLVAGLEHWQEGTHELYKVNPPLPRMLATIPAAVAGHAPLRQDDAGSFQGRPEWPTGIAFVDDHGKQFFDYLKWSRWAGLPFSLLGAFVCFRWAKELAGELAGLTVFALWCLGPTMIANAQLMTPDMAAASMGVLAAYTFRGWLKVPTWKTMLLAGVCFGLALLCKMTWIILFALWPLLWVIVRGLASRAPKEQQGLSRPFQAKAAIREFAQLCVIMVAAVWVLNLGYEFDGSFRPLGEFDFVSNQLRGIPDGEWEGYETGNRFRGTFMERVPVPLPAPFVQGIDFQKSEFEAGYWSYLLGVHRQGGWWYYYILSLLWKVPVGFWIVGLVGTAEWIRVFRSSRPHMPKRDAASRSSDNDGEAVAGARAAGRSGYPGHPASRPDRGSSESDGDGHGQPSYMESQSSDSFRETFAEAVLLLAPLLTILVLVSSHAGFTHHMRYVLPIVPFGFILASRAAAAFSRGYNLRSALTACGLAWGITSSLCASPNHLAYFNELVGGPLNAHHYMGLGPMDSNLVWGQDLLRLVEWTRQNPFARLDGVAYGGLGQVRDAAGVPPAWPPSGIIPEDEADVDCCKFGPRPGWYALSVSRVFSETSEINYFQHFEPFTTIGQTVYIYRVTELELDADQLWFKMHGDKYDRSDCSWRRQDISAGVSR